MINQGSHTSFDMSSDGKAAAQESIEHLKRAIQSGRHWYLALLEAIGLWTAPRESYNGREYRYLIGGEAFDWLLLAERLCDAVNGLVPQKEKEGLLLMAEPPLEVTEVEYRRLLGSEKHRALLNYWYGVVVENALQTSLEQDILKERMAAGLITPKDPTNEAFRRIYGASRKTLLKAFRENSADSSKGTLSMDDLKEFTYWLFKYRMVNSDKARVASDTRRGIVQLQKMGLHRTNIPPHPPLPTERRAEF